MSFKIAIAVSFVGHCFVLAPLGNLFFPAPVKKTTDMEVFYYKIPQPVISPIKTAAPPKEEKKAVQSEQSAAPQPGEVPEAKKEKPQIIKKTRPKRPPNRQLRPEEIFQPLKQNAVPSIPGTTLPNTPECVSYYKYIREEIRRYLKKNYSPEYEEGDVVVSFSLNQAGELVSLGIIEDKSYDNPYLHRISCDSVKSASPFKPFPPGLSQKQISFNLPIVFKQE